MNKNVAIHLKARAEEVAIIMSKPDREFNVNNETFRVLSIKPLSETTAAVRYEKNTGKKALSFFCYVKRTWLSIYVSDSHVLGMEQVGAELAEVEHENWRHNFTEEHKEEKKK